MASMGTGAVVMSRMMEVSLPKVPADDAAGRVPLVLVSDPGQDLDDEIAYILLRFLEHEGRVEGRGVIATLVPAWQRPRLCRGTLHIRGLHHTPVGVGTDGGDTRGVHKAAVFEDMAHSYMPTRLSESSRSCATGRGLVYQIYNEAKPKSLRLVIIAALKDPALFVRESGDLFVKKTCEVVIMAGVEEIEHGSMPEGALPLRPDSSHNNEFDVEAARFFYRRCQELGV